MPRPTPDIVNVYNEHRHHRHITIYLIFSPFCSVLTMICVNCFPRMIHTLNFNDFPCTAFASFNSVFVCACIDCIEAERIGFFSNTGSDSCRFCVQLLYDFPELSFVWHSTTQTQTHLHFSALFIATHTKCDRLFVRVFLR